MLSTSLSDSQAHFPLIGCVSSLITLALNEPREAHRGLKQAAD